MAQHYTADGYEVTEGGAYWDNGLHLVTVTKVASFSEENRNPDSDLFGQVTWWHDTTGGMADGSRLAKRHPFTGELAKPTPTEKPIRLVSGNTIYVESAEANASGTSYVRVCDQGGGEIGYWDSAEWQEDPQGVMGAIFGAALSCPDLD